MDTDSKFFNLPESCDDFTLINEVQMANPEHSPYAGNGLEIEDSTSSIGLHNYVSPPAPDFGTLVQSLDVSALVGDHASDSVFKFLDQILMEDNMDEKLNMSHDPLALQATEKSFYDVIDKKYPQSPSININTEHPRSLCERTSESETNGNSVQSSFTNSKQLVHSANSSKSTSGGQIDSFANMHLVPNIFSHSESVFHFQKGMEQAMKFLPTTNELVFDSNKYALPLNSDKNNSSISRGRKHLPSVQLSCTSSQPLAHSMNSSIINSGGQTDSLINMHLIPSIFSGSEFLMHFRKGMEEAMKFVPTNNELVFDLDEYTLACKSKNEPPKVVVTLEKDQSSTRKGRKHLHCQDNNADTRSRKQLAVSEDEVEELSELFDKVLLRNVKGVMLSSNGYVIYLNGVDIYWKQNELPIPRNGISNKKQGTQIDGVYLQSLLVSCAHDLASNDFQTAHEQLKQIRQYASCTGDAYQRTANVFANSLEARLAGTGTQMYADLASKRISAAENLKDYQVYLSACPFIEVLRVFANKMILKIAATASTLHIVDFGISYGFQWPALIQFLSIRQGGPPKLRITGIDFPQAGFRPAMLIEETCQRLAKCCKRFKVPFEYQTIARQSWDTIDINDLKLARDESLVVNCQLGFQNLPEEPEVVESPKDGILRLIRTMKPDLFVHSIVNGSYNTPLFMTRFREAFFYYSSLFDMLDATLPRNNLQRLQFEKELYGREVMNIIACEGQQRVVRPETYKQWQIRSRRAGFRILPLDKEIVFTKIEASYHKDFLFVEDCKWMLQGWKGRVLYGTSCWVPV